MRIRKPDVDLAAEAGEAVGKASGSTAEGELYADALGAALYGELVALFRRFVILPDTAHYTATALWVIQTHVVAAFDYAPRLIVTSSVKGSGKSRLLELLSYVTHNAQTSSHISAAALVRVIGRGDPPTILLDEADTVFSGNAGHAREMLRAALNGGFRRGQTFVTARGPVDGVERRSIFAMVALAAIGHLPDTIEDRGIVIPMRRRRPDELDSDFQLDRDAPELIAIRSRLELWAASARPRLRGAQVSDVPVRDRAADVWRPLLAIADLLSDEIAEAARLACVRITQATQKGDS